MCWDMSANGTIVRLDVAKEATALEGSHRPSGTWAVHTKEVTRTSPTRAGIVTGTAEGEGVSQLSLRFAAPLQRGNRRRCRKRQPTSRCSGSHSMLLPGCRCPIGWRI